MEELIAILVAPVMVYWGTWVAQRNHRDAPLAAFWSALFGIFAVGVYYIMGDKYESRNIHQDVINSQNNSKSIDANKADTNNQ